LKILLFRILSKKYSVAGFLNYLIFCGPGSLNLLVMFSNLKVSLSFFLSYRKLIGASLSILVIPFLRQSQTSLKCFLTLMIQYLLRQYFIDISDLLLIMTEIAYCHDCLVVVLINSSNHVFVWLYL
jgi:hypothetical protein